MCITILQCSVYNPDSGLTKSMEPFIHGIIEKNDMQPDSVIVHVYVSVTFLWQHMMECNMQRPITLFFLLFLLCSTP